MPKGKIVGTEIGPRTLSSEEGLMLAVLEQAVADLHHTCPAVRADAEAYFFAYNAESSAFSFDAVCGQFGFSANAIRHALRKRPRPARPTDLQRAA